MRPVGMALDLDLLDPSAIGGAVPALGAIRRSPVASDDALFISTHKGIGGNGSVIIVADWITPSVEATPAAPQPAAH